MMLTAGPQNITAGPQNITAGPQNITASSQNMTSSEHELFMLFSCTHVLFVLDIVEKLQKISVQKMLTASHTHLPLTTCQCSLSPGLLLCYCAILCMILYSTTNVKTTLLSDNSA